MKNKIQQLKEKLKSHPKILKLFNITPRVIFWAVEILGLLFIIITIIAFSHQTNEKDKPTQNFYIQQNGTSTIVSFNYSDLLQYDTFIALLSHFNFTEMTSRSTNATLLKEVNGTGGDCYAVSSYVGQGGSTNYHAYHIGFRQFADVTYQNKNWLYYRFYIWDSSNSNDNAKIRVSYYLTRWENDISNPMELSYNYLFRAYADRKADNSNTYSTVSTLSNADEFIYATNNCALQQIFVGIRNNIQSITEQSLQDAYDRGVAYGDEIGRASGYETGYGVGYNNGYNDGLLVQPTDMFSVVKRSFAAISDILNIQILPKLSLGVLLFAPAIIAVVIVIIKMIRG